MGYEGEIDRYHPEQVMEEFTQLFEGNLYCQLFGYIEHASICHSSVNLSLHQSSGNKKISTFCKLSPLPNGECNGELLLVYVRGLLASDETPSLLDSVLHFL